MSRAACAGAGLDPRLAGRFQAGVAQLQARAFGQACALLAPLAAAAPGEPDVRRAYAEALLGAGDLPQAEAEARAAVSADRRRPAAHLTLAEVLTRAGRSGDGEKALRQALALDRRFAPAAIRLNRLLVAQGRAGEGAQATASLAVASRDPELLTAHAEALKADGRREPALEAFERALAADPSGAVAEHNAAAALADLRRDEEALAATDRAFAKGLDAGETWLVRGHALQGLDRYEEAQDAYRQALRRRPALLDAARDLAQLVWMRTADAPRAAAEFDAAMAASGAPVEALRRAKARLLDFAGDRAAALAALEPALGAGADPLTLAAASQIALHLDPGRAAALAEAAVDVRPADAGLRTALIEARIAQGRGGEAAALAEAALAAAPHDQHALALAATAWRMTGDPRYGQLYDYAATVGAYTLDTPPGWADLPAYLADLAVALQRRHGLRTHPVGQSLRQGTQTSGELRRSGDPAIRAFFAAIDAPIRAHIARLGRGRDPLRARARAGHALAGAWSVRLQPGGRHVDHIHADGWLSSAFYVALPPAVAAGGREGWITFGQPGLPVGGAPLGPEHWVKPEPGRLVLFPSYMWHGTEPFGGDAPRLTLAFDVVPA